ncbi:MAG: competence damage-inducible protein A, partial [Thermoproteota archaeon]
MLVFEIITVGNELLDGTVVNTNAAWLAKRISELGFVVRRYTAVGDDIGEIASAIREAIKRGADWIVLSGGLGPTFDDKTLEAVAYALGRKLELNSEALDMVRRKYESYSRETGREIKLTRER